MSVRFSTAALRRRTHARFTAHVAQNLATRQHAIALTLGTSPPRAAAHQRILLVRHEREPGACDCDCITQLEAALAAMGPFQPGIFYLMQEGRGAGVRGERRATRMMGAGEPSPARHVRRPIAHGPPTRSADLRRGPGTGPARREFGAPLVVLTNQSDKLAGLSPVLPIARDRGARGDASPAEPALPRRQSPARAPGVAADAGSGARRSARSSTS